MALLALPHCSVRRTCFDLVYMYVGTKRLTSKNTAYSFWYIFWDFFLPFQDEEEEIKLEINVLRKVCYRSTFADVLKDLDWIRYKLEGCMDKSGWVYGINL